MARAVRRAISKSLSRSDRQVLIAMTMLRSYSRSRSRSKRSVKIGSPRRSVVKVAYGKATSIGHFRAYGDYVAREAATKTEGKGLGFGSAGDELKIGQTLDQWQNYDRRGNSIIPPGPSGEAMARSNPQAVFDKAGPLYRIIISPDDGDRLDMKKHTKSIIKNIETLLATKLDWIAVQHHNTAKTHVHLFIRGLDDRNKELILPKNLKMLGIREMSKKLATAELGLETFAERSQKEAKTIRANYMTDIDRRLLKMIKDNQIVDIGHYQQDNARAKTRANNAERLAYLEKIGLATKVGTNAWRLSDDWDQQLKQRQRESDILKRINQKDQKVSHLELNPGQTISGKVLNIHAIDENPDRTVVTIDTPRGLTWINESGAMRRARDKAQWQTGSVITLTRKEVHKPGSDRTIRYIDVVSHGKIDPADVGFTPRLDVELAYRLKRRLSLEPEATSNFSGLYSQALKSRFNFWKEQGEIENGDLTSKAKKQIFQNYKEHLSVLKSVHMITALSLLTSKERVGSEPTPDLPERRKMRDGPEIN